MQRKAYILPEFISQIKSNGRTTTSELQWKEKVITRVKKPIFMINSNFDQYQHVDKLSENFEVESQFSFDINGSTEMSQIEGEKTIKIDKIKKIRNQTKPSVDNRRANAILVEVPSSMDSQMNHFKNYDTRQSIESSTQQFNSDQTLEHFL